MDEDARKDLKFRFARLAILLNILVLCSAGIVLGFFLFPEGVKVPAIALMAAILVVLSYRFARLYRSTKSWLADH